MQYQNRCDLTLHVRLRWLNTVLARTFADAIQRAHKDCKNKYAVNRAIVLFTQHPHYLYMNAVYW